jgi:hypothetical protein
LFCLFFAFSSSSFLVPLSMCVRLPSIKFVRSGPPQLRTRYLALGSRVAFSLGRDVARNYGHGLGRSRHLN